MLRVRLPIALEEAAILTIDGVGEWATASISKRSGLKLRSLKANFPHSLGYYILPSLIFRF